MTGRGEVPSSRCLGAVAAKYRVSVKDVVEGCHHKPSGATVWDVVLVVSRGPIGVLGH